MTEKAKFIEEMVGHPAAEAAEQEVYGRVVTSIEHDAYLLKNEYVGKSIKAKHFDRVLNSDRQTLGDNWDYKVKGSIIQFKEHLVGSTIEFFVDGVARDSIGDFILDGPHDGFRFLEEEEIQTKTIHKKRAKPNATTIKGVYLICEIFEKDPTLSNKQITERFNKVATFRNATEDEKHPYLRQNFVKDIVQYFKTGEGSSNLTSVTKRHVDKFKARYKLSVKEAGYPHAVCNVKTDVAERMYPMAEDPVQKPLTRHIPPQQIAAADDVRVAESKAFQATFAKEQKDPYERAHEYDGAKEDLADFLLSAADQEELPKSDNGFILAQIAEASEAVDIIATALDLDRTARLSILDHIARRDFGVDLQTFLFGEDDEEA